MRFIVTRTGTSDFTKGFKPIGITAVCQTLWSNRPLGREKNDLWHLEAVFQKNQRYNWGSYLIFEAPLWWNLIRFVWCKMCTIKSTGISHVLLCPALTKEFNDMNTHKRIGLYERSQATKFLKPVALFQRFFLWVTSNFERWLNQKGLGFLPSAHKLFILFPHYFVKKVAGTPGPVPVKAEVVCFWVSITIIFLAITSI